MRLILFVVITLATGLSIAAQATFSWGVELFPHYGHRRLAVNESFTQLQIDSLEAAEAYRPGIGAGFFLSWRVEKIGFQMGLGYLNTGYRSRLAPFPATDPNSINFKDFRQVFRTQQVEVPTALNFYQRLSEKNEFNFMFGLSLGVNITNDDILVRYTDEVSDQVITDPEFKFKRVNLAFQTGMGWEHHFSQRFTLSLQPTFRFWLRGLYPNDTAINRNLYQLGLRTTIRFDRPMR